MCRRRDLDTNAQLDFLKGALGLSETKLAHLFKVSRQATSQWRDRGVPPERSAQVDRVVELAQFLQRRLVPQRIPEIIRTPAKGLDGKDIYTVLRDRGPEDKVSWRQNASRRPPSLPWLGWPSSDTRRIRRSFR